MVKKDEEPFINYEEESISSFSELFGGTPEEVANRFKVFLGLKENATFTITDYGRDNHGCEDFTLTITYANPMTEEEIVAEKIRREQYAIKIKEINRKTAEVKKKLSEKRNLENKRYAEKQLAKLIKDNPELAKQIIEEQT